MKNSSVGYFFLFLFCSLAQADFGDFSNHTIFQYNQRFFNATYNGRGYDESHIIDFNEIESSYPMRCDNGRIIIQMKDPSFFISKMTQKPMFMTNVECMSPIFYIRDYQLSGNTLFIYGGEATLGDIMPDLDLTIENLKSDTEKTKHFCIGINTNQQDCETPKDDLSVYQWSGPGGFSIDVTCPDCFVGFQGDVFIHLVVQTTKLAKVEGGIKNAVLNTALVLDINANENFNVGVDKVLELVPPTTLFSFSLLTIPITFWFEIPANLNANLEIEAEGDVTIGWEGQWTWGDYYLEWTKDHPQWKINLGKPEATSKTIFNASANAESTSLLSVSPSIQFNLDKVFHAELDTTPHMDGLATWDSSTNQLCANVTYEVEMDAFAEFDLDVSWLGIHDQYKWGPVTIYDSGTKPLEIVCKKF